MHRHLGLLALAAALAGCPSGSPTAPELLAKKPPSLLVTVDAPDFIEVAGGESAAVNVRVHLADGTPATDYTLDAYVGCHADGAADCTVIAPTKGQGSEQIILHGTHANFTTLIAKAVRRDGTVFGSEAHHVIFLPEFGDRLVPVVTAATMAVGERRAFGALGHQTFGNVSSAAAPTYAIAESQVASVDADGVVTARAAGAATLQLTLGPLTASVPLTVDGALTLGPPGDVTQYLQLTQQVPRDNDSIGVGPAWNSPGDGLEVDSRGYPHLLLHVGTRLVLASWTGSGFGSELLPDAFNETGEGGVAIDERDRVYVVADGVEGKLLFEKDAAAPPSAWRHRSLDMHVVELERAGLDPDRVGFQGSGLPALLPRLGGGLELAYRLDVATPGYAYPCGLIYRYAEITDDAIATSDVTSDWYTPSEGRCQRDELGHATPAIALARGAAGDAQLVVPWGDRAPTSPGTFYEGVATYTRGADGRWTTPAPTPLPQHGHFPRPGPSESIHVANSPIEDGGAPPSVVIPGLSGNDLTRPFAFACRRQVYVGFDNVSVARSGVLAEDMHDFDLQTLTPVDLGPVPTAEQMYGAACRHDTLHFAASGLNVNIPDVFYVSRQLAPLPVTDPTEATGLTLDDQQPQTELRTAPARLADGTRVALTWGRGDDHAQDTGRIFRSPAPGQPWVEIPQAVLFASETELRAAGAALFAMSYGNELLRSTDQGSSWQTVSPPASPQTGGLLHFLVVPGGGVVADFGDHLVLGPDPTAASVVSWVTVAESAVVNGGYALDPSATGRLLTATPGGVALAAAVFGQAQQLHVRTLAWDGTTTSDQDFGGTFASGQVLQVGLGAASGGALVFTSHSNQATDGHTLSHRVELATGNWTVSDLGLALTTGPVAATASGVVLGAALDVTGPVPRRQAVLLRSADGATWGAPVPTRPQGGRDQSFDFVIEDGDGLLTVVRDNLDLAGNNGPAIQILQRVAP